MSHLVNQFWNDETGFVLSAELVIILTVAVLGIIVGLSYLQTAVVNELSDVGSAISSLNQSYAYTGYYSRSYFGKFKSFMLVRHIIRLLEGEPFLATMDVITCSVAVVIQKIYSWNLKRLKSHVRFVSREKWWKK